MLRKNILKYGVAYASCMIILIAYLLCKLSLIRVCFTYSTLYNMISITIGSLSSIGGIIVAVYILGLSLKEKYFVSNTLINIADSSIMNYYLQLIISTICIMLLANITLDTSLNNFGLNLVAVGEFYYIASLVTLYPLIMSLIKESRPISYVDLLIGRLNEESASDYQNQTVDLKVVENNPFYELSSISIRMLETNERITLLKIIESCGRIAQNSLTDERKEVILDAIVHILYNLSPFLKEPKNKWAAQDVILEYVKIRKYGVKNHISNTIFRDYENLITNLCISLSDTDIIYYYINYLFDFLELNINEFVPEEESLFLFRNDMEKSFDADKQNQWDYISYDLISIIESINTKVVNDGNIDAINSINLNYNQIFESIAREKALGVGQRNYLINRVGDSYLNFIKKAVEKIDMYRSTFDLLILLNILKVDFGCFYVLYNAYFKLIAQMGKLKKLSYIELNNWGGLGRGLVAYIENVSDNEVKSYIKRAIQDIVDLTIDIASSIKKESIYTLETYIIAHDQAESIVKMVKDEELSAKLESKLSSMSEYESIKTKLNSNREYIKLMVN